MSTLRIRGKCGGSESRICGILTRKGHSGRRQSPEGEGKNLFKPLKGAKEL